MKNNLATGAILIAAIIGGVFGEAIVKSIFQRGDSISFDHVLVEASKKINATLPMLVDKDTRLDATVAGPGNRLTYLYTLVNFSSSDLKSAEFIDVLRSQLINGYRTNPSMAAFREKQVELCYYYRNRDGDTVATIIISPKDF